MTPMVVCRYSVICCLRLVYAHDLHLIYGFSWFPSFHDHPLVDTSPGLHNNSDVLVTVQPPSSVNQFLSLTVLAIALLHPCTVFLWFHSLVFKLF